MTDSRLMFRCMLALAAVAVVLFGQDALASTDDFGGVGAAVCGIVQAVTGNLGSGIAALAVVFLGIGAFFGKVTWGLAITTGIGIFAIFGTTEIINAFSSGNGACTT